MQPGDQLRVEENVGFGFAPDCAQGNRQRLTGKIKVRRSRSLRVRSL